MADNKNCFVIAPIGESGSDTRKRSDQVLKHVIKPAVASCGYEAVRADEIDKPGMITSQVIQHIHTAPLVVADLTEYNPNVFYELAIRHALRKPFIHLIEEGERIPFDVANTRTIYVNHRDLDSVDSAKNGIINQIKALEKDASNIETPFSVSLDLQALRQSEKPEERSLADLVAVVSDINTGLGKLGTKIDTSREITVDQIQTAIMELQRRIYDFDITKGRFPHNETKGHRTMLRELGRVRPKISPALNVLIATSLFRDSLPWVYELGLEIYRAARNGEPTLIREAIGQFRQPLSFLVDSNLGIENRNSREIFMFLIEEIDPILDDLVSSVKRGRSRSP